MAEAEFHFVYHPEDHTNTLDAYDASQALYGISRSLSILAHYLVNGRVIKQAPYLRGAKVLVEPPKIGSFEFIVPIIQAATDPANVTAVAQGLSGNLLYDLTKFVFRRLAGKSEAGAAREMSQLAKQFPGDLDAITDSVSEDVVRIQRPLIQRYQPIRDVNVSGNGVVNIINFDRDTFDFARSKVIGDKECEYFGVVNSFNGNTMQGRFWVTEEERTVGYSKHKGASIPAAARRTLSWSLDQWVQGSEGFIFVQGFPLSSRTGLLKHVFVTSVRRA